MSKLSALVCLTLLVATLVAVNVAVLPNLAFFFDVGTVDGMFDTGKMVGGALGAAFGSDIFEFVGIVLFLA